MLAILARGCLAYEEGVALVACTTDSLNRVSADFVYASTTVWHDELDWLDFGARFEVIDVDSDGCTFSTFLLVTNLLLGSSLGWESRAFLASSMGAVGTGLIGAKRGLAAMALAVDSHHDLLLDPLTIPGGRSSPLAWLKGEAILGKQSAGFLLASLHMFKGALRNWPRSFLVSFGWCNRSVDCNEGRAGHGLRGRRWTSLGDSRDGVPVGPARLQGLARPPDKLAEAFLLITTSVSWSTHCR